MKFKNIKKKAKNTKSPSNSRTIPEPFKFPFPKFTATTFVRFYRGSLKFFIMIIFMSTATVVGLDLYNNLNTKQEIDSQRGKMMLELSFWKDFISERESYRDAYFQASILEYKLGNALQAKNYVKKGLALDPNSEDGRKIEELLRR